MKSGSGSKTESPPSRGLSVFWHADFGHDMHLRQTSGSCAAVDRRRLRASSPSRLHVKSFAIRTHCYLRVTGYFLQPASFVGVPHSGYGLAESQGSCHRKTRRCHPPHLCGARAALAVRRALAVLAYSLASAKPPRRFHARLEAA